VEEPSTERRQQRNAPADQIELARTCCDRPDANELKYVGTGTLATAVSAAMPFKANFLRPFWEFSLQSDAGGIGSAKPLLG
jgi:hypothetical protein